MQEMTMQEIKQVSLTLLEKFDEVCRANSIAYYLAYGTLLGAVRHKGFIPWDDDIDIWVPCEQFDSLMEILSDELGYEVLNYRNGTFWMCFSKFSDMRTVVIDPNSQGKEKRRGISVDIFPLFGCGQNDVNKYCIVGKARNIMWLYENGYQIKPLKRAICAAMKVGGLNESYWREKLGQLQEKRSDAPEIGNPISRYGKRDVHPRECFEVIELEFEGRKFNAPRGYNHVLTDIYGNYMQLPPEKERVKTHSAKPFWCQSLKIDDE